MDVTLYDQAATCKLSFSDGLMYMYLTILGVA